SDLYAFPGRSAARSDALQTRDHRERGACGGPGSAVHHFAALVLHRVRDTQQRRARMKAFPLTRLIDKGAAIFLILLAAFAIAVPVLNLLVPNTSGLHVSTYLVALFGKYICYAILALSIDLIWGY